MKPIGTNNLSFLGYVALFILFSLPYVGVPAFLFCAIFPKNTSVKRFARIILLINIILTVVLSIISILGLGGIGYPAGGGIKF